jgi:hypothetical protein
MVSSRDCKQGTGQKKESTMKRKKTNAKTLSAKQMKKVKGQGLRAMSINPNSSMISTGLSGSAGTAGVTAPLPPTAVR